MQRKKENIKRYINGHSNYNTSSDGKYTAKDLLEINCSKQGSDVKSSSLDGPKTLVGVRCTNQRLTEPGARSNLTEDQLRGPLSRIQNSLVKWNTNAIDETIEGDGTKSNKI